MSERDIAEHVRRQVASQRAAAKGIHGKRYNPKSVAVVLDAGEVEELLAEVDRLRGQTRRLGAMRRRTP